MDITILVGGAAGQGIETVVRLLEKTIKNKGLFIFTYKNYMSMVRGGHNFMQIRVSDKPLTTFSNRVDIIFALTIETIDKHINKLKKDGIIIIDEDIEVKIEECYNIKRLALGKKAKESGSIKALTTVGFGVLVKYLNLDIDYAKDICNTTFGDKLAKINENALMAGVNLIDDAIECKSKDKKSILINGNEALALGAIAAGMRFYCGYPMTPATSIMSTVSKYADRIGIVVDQVEDEVAALNMVLGASYAGVRAMTASSGGGFALMVEALSLAGITELPAVIVNAQRPGPATGLSTRTEQSDLRFVIHAGHGEFPKMVITLRTPEDCFYQTARAFNIAEKYQIPVILMTEEFLTDYNMTTEPFNFDKIKIERHLANENELEQERYKRYKYTENGISNRIIPGKISNMLVLVDSHEHNEYGNIDESIETRTKMTDKRMKKLDLLEKEINEPWNIGNYNSETVLLAFGATFGALNEAINTLVSDGEDVSALIFGDIWPIPTNKLSSLTKNAKRVITVENNATAQLKGLINEHTNCKVKESILKYDGRPFNGEEIVERYRALKNSF